MASDDNRLDRLARRAKELDDMIAKTAKMQKKIVEEIQRIGKRDRLMKQRASATPRTRRRRSRS
jgi:hypothetical protein